MIKRSRRVLCVLAAAAAAAGLVTAAPTAALAGVLVTFPAQAMDGNLQVSPGTVVQAGYAFQMPGSHPAAQVVFAAAVATFDASCVSGPGGGVITVPLRRGPYVVPASAGGWVPGGASYEGSAVVPDLCGGDPVSLARGGSFTAGLRSSDAGDPVRVQWHYAAAGQGGGWSHPLAFTPGPGGPPPPPAVVFGVQAMDGNLQVSPGATVEAGYGLQMPGSHPAARVIFPGAVARFAASCVSGPGGGLITVHLSQGSYTDPAGGGNWVPTADPSSLAGYQGSAVVPDLCSGGPVSLAQGGSFASGLRSSDVTDPVQVRWHYAIAGPAGGQGGGWSGGLSFTPGPGVPPPPPAPVPTQIIVKVNLAGGYTIGDVTANFPVTVDTGGLASRGIYLVSPTLPQSHWPPGELRQLATQINGDHTVVDYAEENLPVKLADTEFYAWPYGPPTPYGTLPKTFTHQPAATTLQLAAAHQQTEGAGVTVAVLDTGASPVPALRGRLLTGWNYLADNTHTRDAGPADSTAVGHGTFVSGLIALVAPKAKILPEKVLNANGYGTVYGAAQAILDATAAGAGVINLSFGTATQPPSSLLQQAIQQSQQAGVIVVAAAGNAGSNQQTYPAAWPQVLSVAATDQANADLTNFSNWGGWVQVGAPGEQVVGPIPDGSYDIWAGTSMSAPFVSGQAALIRSLVPGIHPDHLFQAIENTATHLPNNPIHSGAINLVPSLGFAVTHP